MAPEAAPRRGALAEPPTLELVLKRNSVERLKREKSPLGILDELPHLIATGYADIPEEDIVRLKWWGLYHDKPKVGTFMLRIKLPAGRLTPLQARAVGELSNTYGRGAGELSTRQTIQLHYLALPSLPSVFDRLEEVGLTTAGACGDAVRNVTGCPLYGVAHDELFDVTPVVDEVTSLLLRPPRLHRPAAQAQDLDLRLRAPVQRAGDQLHLAGRRDPRGSRGLRACWSAEGSRPCRGSHASSECSSRRTRRSTCCARCSTPGRKTCATASPGSRPASSSWSTTTAPKACAPRSSAVSVASCQSFALPPHPQTRADHLGVQPESREGRSSIGVPVHVGLISGDQLVGLAALAEELGDDIRITRQQNFVLTGVATERVDEARSRLTLLGFDLEANGVRGGSIACTGEPHCNFSVTETKTRLDSLIQALEQRFGDAIADLRLHLDGCPHACAQHWVGDIGFQGSTVRDAEGKRHQAFEIYLRGSLGPEAAIGRPLFRRVPTYELDDTVAGLIGGWLEQRTSDEGFRSFCDRLDDDARWATLAGREPAKARAREEAAA